MLVKCIFNIFFNKIINLNTSKLKKKMLIKKKKIKIA